MMPMIGEPYAVPDLDAAFDGGSSCRMSAAIRRATARFVRDACEVDMAASDAPVCSRGWNSNRVAKQQQVAAREQVCPAVGGKTSEACVLSAA
jgi:hypothetical protein